MSSPFPGMDPYLEGNLWTTLHGMLVPEMVRQLSPKLRPKYLVFTNEYFLPETPESASIATAPMYPDVGVKSTGVPSAGIAAVGIVPAPIRVATIMPTMVPHVSLEIRERENRELVAGIELLSPTNKKGLGRKRYLRKRNRILESDAHLIEIDLLHAGQRLPMKDPLPPAPYYVFVGRSELRPVTEVWPFTLEQPLPTVPVPLLSGDADVPLDLQSAFSAVYDQVGYDLAIDYSKPPDAPLSPQEEVWVKSRLKTYS